MARNVPKYTKQQVAVALQANMGNMTFAARALGCTPACVLNYLNRYPSLKALRDRLREKQVDMAEQALFEKVREGNMAAIIFTLKTLGKERGYVENVQLSGPVEIRTVVQLPDDFPSQAKLPPQAPIDVEAS